MRNLEFKLYLSKKNKKIHQAINIAGIIHNHCIALHRRYYRRYKKTLNCNQLKTHIAKIRNRKSEWKIIDAQAVQDICERINLGYEKFFRDREKGIKTTNIPNFKKVKKYKSFTLKQNGYKLLNNHRIKIGKTVYSYFENQPIDGIVKTVTVKRLPLGELSIFVVVDESTLESNLLFSILTFLLNKKITIQNLYQYVFTTSYLINYIEQIRFQEEESRTGKIAGFDFGLKTFLTGYDGTEHFTIESPQFLKQSLNELRKAHRKLSSKKEGSGNWHRAKKHLNRVYEKISNQRKDWFYKLAHQLTKDFDILVFETLNMEVMKQKFRWGRKISDIAFGDFKLILEWIASKKNKLVHYIKKWFPSSRICYRCNFIRDKLDLSQRRWICPQCHKVHQRDKTAATNIYNVDIIQLGQQLLDLGKVRQVKSAFTH